VNNSQDYRIQLLIGAGVLLLGIIWGWISLPSRFKRWIGLFGLGITLLVGLLANINLIENPPTKITAYYQEHGYSETVPETMTDTAAMWTDLISINLTVAFAGGICLLLGGLVFPSRQQNLPAPIPHQGTFIHLPTQAVASTMIDKLEAVKASASQATVLYFQKSGQTDKIEGMSRQLVRFSDLLDGWGTSANIGRKELLRWLAELDLEDPFVEKLSTAIHSRYGSFLYKEMTFYLLPVLFQAKESAIANNTGIILPRIFTLLQEGKSETTAVWEGLSAINGGDNGHSPDLRAGAASLTPAS
jgi:hypothetical protein